MTNQQIFTYLDALGAVAQVSGGARFAYAVAKNYGALSRAIEPFFEARKALVEQAPKIKQEDGTEAFADKDALEAEMQALLAEEVGSDEPAVRVRSISPDDLPGGLTPAQVASLEWMIADEAA